MLRTLRTISRSPVRFRAFQGQFNALVRHESTRKDENVEDEPKTTHFGFETVREEEKQAKGKSPLFHLA